MMQIMYFSQKKQFLDETYKLAGEKIYIAPSPVKADNLRLQLAEVADSSSALNVVTIAKFTSDLLELCSGGGESLVVKRKADLLLVFGILKNKYLPDLGFEQFQQAYGLFSDLRSFTLNEEALTSVLAEQSPEIRQTIQLFWKLIEATGYLDEHAAYSAITENLRNSTEIPDDKNKKLYVFWGFHFFNGQQVDLLKALAGKHDVIIPFPLALKDKIKRSDWISWLKDYQVEEMDLPEVERAPKAKWIAVNSREIALNLKEVLDPGAQVVLGVSQLEMHHIDIIPHGGVDFKIPHSLLHNELSEISHTLKNHKLNTPEIDFNTWLIETRKKFLEATDKIMPFKKLKALQLYEEAYRIMESLSDEVPEIDEFFIKLLGEVAYLNQPRTFFVPLSEEKPGVELKDMSMLEDLDVERKIYLCIDDRFDDIHSLNQGHSEKIQKELSALGPLKRVEMELSFKQWEFENLFSHADVTVLMAESVLKHSLVWKKLFQKIHLEKVEDSLAINERKPLDHFLGLEKKIYTGDFSASRFQSYVDCPRKFYYSYVEKVTPSISLEKDIDPMLSGTIIHKIIEEYFHRQLSESDLAELTKEIFDKAIVERKLALPLEVYLQRELIFNHRALNGIKFLHNLENIIGEKVDWKIEEDFEVKELGGPDGIRLTGKMDCIGINSKVAFLLDFKSSQAAASSNTDVEDMESLQLWVYALGAQKIIPDFDKKSIVLGYVVLDDPAKSNLLFMDEDIFSKIRSSKLCRTKKLEESFFESLESAKTKIGVLAQAIRTDNVFKAQPRKIKNCDYCELARVCVKSELSDV